MDHMMQLQLEYIISLAKKRNITHGEMELDYSTAMYRDREGLDEFFLPIGNRVILFMKPVSEIEDILAMEDI